MPDFEHSEENGWVTELPPWRPGPEALARRHEEQERWAQLRTVELLASMERRLEELHDRVARLERDNRVRRAAA